MKLFHISESICLTSEMARTPREYEISIYASTMIQTIAAGIKAAAIQYLAELSLKQPPIAMKTNAATSVLSQKAMKLTRIQSCIECLCEVIIRTHLQVGEQWVGSELDYSLRLAVRFARIRSA
jgi:hypothetical protein